MLIGDDYATCKVGFIVVTNIWVLPRYPDNNTPTHSVRNTHMVWGPLQSPNYTPCRHHMGRVSGYPASKTYIGTIRSIEGLGVP